MKHLQRIIVTAMLAIGIFCSAFYIGCKKNKCGSNVCNNGGICDDNVCECAQGYSGSSCQTGWSDEFVGTYDCTRGTCVPAIPGTSVWQSIITKDASNSGYTVDISNFDDGGSVTIAALVDSIGNISISPAAGASGTHATGTFLNDTIRLTYTTSAVVGTTFTCTMMMVKQ